MKTKALFDAKRLIAQIVTDVVNLEDINYTVPEVQTLLDGITVGGHKLQDELITLNQIKAWQFLFASIEQGEFAVNKDYLLRLHGLVANQEALRWGEFRTGQVSIFGTEYLPPKSERLDSLWLKQTEDTNSRIAENLSFKDGVLKTQKAVNIYVAAIDLFGQMARIKFFMHANRRVALMMMSGILLSHGLPMIDVPAKRKLEFNQMMIDYYNTEQFDPLLNFMLSCIPDYIKEEYNLKV